MTELHPLPVALVIVGVMGWPVAFSLLGLWWGERNRRIDSQKREVQVPVYERPIKSAQSATRQDATPDSEDLDQGRANYIAQMVREGYSPEEAAEDWDAMAERLHSDQE